MKRGRGGRGKREGERKRGLTTRRGIRTVEFQPDLKTIQVGSKIQRTFRFTQNVQMYLIMTTRMIIGQYTNGRKADGGWREEG